ncbi:MAG: hypothetical protein NTV34_14135, partial [Proteobacteria bacterium]|nr:hypothetical protein [Pseudomonadota bacterium]
AYTARLETIFLQRGIEANQFYVTVQLIDDSVESFDLARDLLSRITFDKEGSSKLPPMPEATMVLEPSLKKAEVVAKIPNRAAELETFNLACETQQPDRDGRPPYYDLECKSVSDPEVRGYIHLKELDASRKATNFLFRSLSRLNKGSAYFECAPLGSNPSLRNCVLER